jgi:hypothetical protein
LKNPSLFWAQQSKKFAFKYTSWTFSSLKICALLSKVFPSNATTKVYFGMGIVICHTSQKVFQFVVLPLGSFDNDALLGGRDGGVLLHLGNFLACNGLSKGLAICLLLTSSARRHEVL